MFASEPLSTLANPCQSNDVSGERVRPPAGYNVSQELSRQACCPTVGYCHLQSIAADLKIRRDSNHDERLSQQYNVSSNQDVIADHQASIKIRLNIPFSF